LFAWKGKKSCIIMGDVIDVPPVRTKKHAAEKPVELYRRLLSRSCQIGDTVLDPCCGTGTIFPAATLCRVTATGIEQDEETGILAEARKTEKE
jgi:DNA modification methylase